MRSERPDDVKQAIQGALLQLTRQDSSQWGLRNGKSKNGYGIGKISDFLVVEKIILAGLNKGQKAFNFIDVGAGEFNWGRGVAEFVNNHPLFREKDITVFIYSLRGESNSGPVETPQGHCTLYEYGSFAVENLMSEFQQGSIDLIVSSWCFIHLVDPFGTFVQCYNLLRPETGLMFIEGFCLDIDNSKTLDFQALKTDALLKLFSVANIPCFMLEDSYGGKFNDFVIGKSNASVSLPLEYKGIKTTHGDIGCGHITSFTATSEFEHLVDSVRLVEHGKINRSRYVYNENSQDSENLIKWVMQDNPELASAYTGKLMLLSRENDNDPNVTKDFYACLGWLIKNTPKKALESVNQLLQDSEQAIRVLFNKVPGNALDLLYECMNDSKKLDLFKKLVEISSEATLNTELAALNLTLLITACYLEKKEAVSTLLASNKVDTNASSTSLILSKGKHTALSIIKKQNIAWPEIIATLEKGVTINTQVSPGQSRYTLMPAPTNESATVQEHSAKGHLQLDK